MKKRLKPAEDLLKKFILSISALFLTVYVFAQDKQVDVNISTKKDNFWGQPWVWVVGVAVFILLLVAILRSGRKDV